MPKTLVASALFVLLPSFALGQSSYPAPMESDFIARDVRFESGERAPEVRIHYRTIGQPRVGGAVEGLAIGAVVGLAYGLSARAPKGSGLDAAARARAALATGMATAAACVAISLLGASLAGASLNTIARAFQGSQVGLVPLARLLGEPEIGPLTRAALGAWEGLLFGASVVLGFTRRR